MPYRVHLTVDMPYRARVNTARLRSAARAALRQAGAPADGELSIAITSDEALRELNRRFLGEDHATDVLSFPAGEADPETGRPYLGDLAIAYPRAREQARRAGHPVWAELSLLVVHGVLHLLGHDHAEPEEKTRMWRAQDEILRRLRVPLRRVSE